MKARFYQSVVIFTSSNTVKSLIFVVGSIFFGGIRITYLLLHDNKYTESLDKDINVLQSHTFLFLKFSKVENFTDKVIMNNSSLQITTYYIHHCWLLVISLLAGCLGFICFFIWHDRFLRKNWFKFRGILTKTKTKRTHTKLMMA